MAITSTAAKVGNIFHLVGFILGGEEFCVDILKVQEIIRMVDITKMPNAPEYVEGVINLRGRVIPVVDLRNWFHLGESQEEEGSRRIVVASINGVRIGLVVDQVSQVFKLPGDQVAPAPDAVKRKGSECISGVGMMAEKLLILLDLKTIY